MQLLHLPKQNATELRKKKELLLPAGSDLLISSQFHFEETLLNMPGEHLLLYRSLVFGNLLVWRNASSVSIPEGDWRGETPAIILSRHSDVLRTGINTVQNTNSNHKM